MRGRAKNVPGGGAQRRTRATIVISHKIVIVIVPVPRVASLCAGEPATPETADPGAAAPAHRRPGLRGASTSGRGLFKYFIHFIPHFNCELT